MQRMWKLMSRGRLVMLFLGVSAIALAGYAGLVLLGAQRAVDRSASARADEVAYKLTTYAGQRGPLFERVASIPGYTAGAWWDGRLYLAGPAGLTIVDADGVARHVLRTGIELPAEAITAVIGARLRGASETQIVLATAGAGVLVLGPEADGVGAVEQMLPDEIAARDLVALAGLPDGELLLGTRDAGVLAWDGVALRPLRFNVPGVDAARLEVTALAAVDASSYLIGTRAQGVFYAHGGTVQQSDESDAGTGLPDKQVVSLAVADGHAYVGTPVGVADFALDTWTAGPLRTLARGAFANALSVEGGELRVGTLDQGMEGVRLDEVAGPHLRRAEFATAPERVDGFVATPQGAIAIRNGLVAGVSGARAGLTDRNVSALAFDADGELYVGYFDRGLDVVGERAGVRHLEDDHLFCINRLVLDPVRRTMAAATANGLVLFDGRGKARQTLTRKDGLISEHVSDVVFTQDGAAVATPAGISFVSGSGVESLYAFEGLVNNHVYALAGGPDGRLLAGTLGGLSVLEGERVERSLTVANSGLKHNWITALLPLPEGGTLVGTYGAGLQVMDGAGQFAAVELPSGVARDLVINPNALYETPTHVYAGTLGHGLLVLDRATGRWSSVTAGLPSLNVTAFAARGGVLYVGTEDGLVRAREADLP